MKNLFLASFPSQALMRFLLTGFALVLLCLPLLAAFASSQMLRSDDGTLHLYRAIALDHSLRVDGSLYPRFSSGLVYGYGASLFNYFPPTSYYPVVLLHQIGLSFIEAYNASMMLFILIAATGAYLLGREWTNPYGGFITAAAYVYAPYLVFSAVTRGTITELAGMAFLAWAMWGLTRLALHPSRLSFGSALACFALFIPMHNIVTLHGTAMLAAYCAFLWLSSSQKKMTFIHLFLVGISAVLLTAFFWLPALGETSATQLKGTAENLSSIDVTRSLRSLGDVFALPHTADPSQLQQIKPIVLSNLQALIGCIGLGLLLIKRQSSQRLRLMLVLALFVLVGVLLQLEISAPLWEAIPLLGFSQFAWRMMSLPSLALALLTGLGAVTIVEVLTPHPSIPSPEGEGRLEISNEIVPLLSIGKALGTKHTPSLETATIPSPSTGRARVGSAFRVGLLCYAMLLFGLLLYSTAWLYTTYFDLSATSIRDTQDYERKTGELTLSSYSEYLPITANKAALDPNALVNRFATHDTIERLIPPSGVSISRATWTGTSASLLLEAESETLLIFDWLYIAAWQAELDGSPIELQPTPEGYLSLSLPAGTHEISIYLGQTRLSQIATVLGIVGLLIAVIGMRYIPSAIRAHYSAPLQSTPLQMILLGLIGLVFLIFKITVIDTTNNPLHRQRLQNGQITSIATAFEANFNNTIRLLGYEMPETAPSGGTIPLRLYWTVYGDSPTADYSSILELRDAQGLVIAQSGSFMPANRATSRWLDGFYLEETVYLEIPPYTPPTPYTVNIGLYLPETGQRLDLINAAGNPQGVSVSIGTMQVHPDQTPYIRDTLATSSRLDLLAIEGLTTQAQVGDEMQVSLLWRSKASLPASLMWRLLWLDGRGEILAQTGNFPLINDYNNAAWAIGEIWRGQQRVYVAGGLGAGTFELALQLGDERIPLPQTMQVSTPERHYDPDIVSTPLAATWTNGMRLLGYHLEEQALTLYWQTDSQIDASWHLFLHLVDENEQIVAVQGGIPSDWTRPTSSWAKGEIISTHYDFADLNPLDYTWRIGWFLPETSQRLALADGTDAFEFRP